MPPPRVVVVAAAPPVVVAPPDVVVVPVPLIVADSRVEDVVVVVVSVLPQELKRSAHRASAGMMNVIFFIVSIVCRLLFRSGIGRPAYRVVVDCVVVVVLAAAGRVVTACSRTTVVVVGAGVSTTVVQELSRLAARAIGARIMKFFIVSFVPPSVREAIAR
jgi:hypothetical protein